MSTKNLFLLTFLTGFNITVFSQVTSYNFDPAKIDKELASKTDSLYQEDQKYRLELSQKQKEGAPKHYIDSLKNIIRLKDRSNLTYATQLIERHGWLGPQEIGFQGTQALFLIIQHADLQTQKKYYPLILQAEKEGKTLSSNVAILEDRIAVREGRRQTYGSQTYYDADKKKNYVYPLTNPEGLDDLRKSRGLQPMKEYRKDWDINDYNSYVSYANELLKKSRDSNKQ